MFTTKVFMESPVEKLKVTSENSVMINCIHCKYTSIYVTM